jgi:hypothetical protein
MAWWVLYMVYMIARGRFYGVPQTKYDTAYHYTMRSTKMFGYSNEKYYQISPLVLFMSCHAFGAFLTISFSYVLWNNFWLHTGFCFTILSICIYNGAMRYYNMMTKYYIKSLERLLDDKKKK